MPAQRFVGLMSGTSVDAIDCAIVRCTGTATELEACQEHPIPQRVRDAIAALSHPGENEIERLGALDRELGQLFAKACLQLLEVNNFQAEDIVAIGSHGQTVRHHPPSRHQPGEQGFSLQIGDPNTIAELTGITTVADFRRRDIAAGGEGAPLAPAFHASAFSAAGTVRAIVNIGGIANVSLLDGQGGVLGFDTGPGNTLLDHWISQQRGEAYDRDGAWSAEGQVHEALLERLLGHPFLSASGPRSTGKEEFNLPWLEQALETLEPVAPQSVQATLAELTARSIADAIKAQGSGVQEVFVCGGGARNTDLMRRLYRHLKPAMLDTTAALGIAPEWVEAAAFAWLAYRSLSGLSGNMPSVTGAREERILGGIYPAGRIAL